MTVLTITERDERARDAEAASHDRTVRLGAMAVEPHPGVAPASIAHAEPTHWKCPTCFTPCRCTGDARLMLHAACGLTTIERS